MPTKKQLKTRAVHKILKTKENRVAPDEKPEKTKERKRVVLKTARKQKPQTLTVQTRRSVNANWSQVSTKIKRKKESSHADDAHLAKMVAMDCEMVGVGPDGVASALARVVLLDGRGKRILDAYCKPHRTITDYRTAVSGIREQDLIGAGSIEEVREQVQALINGRVVVGHGLENDFQVLGISHPKQLIRDSAHYRPLQRAPNASHKLSFLAKEHLGVDMHDGEHDPVQDARVALRLYEKFATEWEASVTKGGKKSKSRKGKN